MQISYIQLAENEVPELARRLTAESYPTRCTIVSIEGTTSNGTPIPRSIRIELTASLPGVLLRLEGHEQFIDWAIRSLVDLAKQTGAPTS
jgi:hypothetical protein